MDSFYLIVLSIALGFLIIVLTFFGMTMAKTNTTVVFPPIKNTCPDYWTVTPSADGKNTYCKAGTINQPQDIIKDKQIGRNTDGSYDFANPIWSSTYNKTNICALNAWTNKHKVSWDGVSNFNGC